MKKLLLYIHGGSGNKGCEAIVRSTLNIIGFKKENVRLSSWNAHEDFNAKLDEICEIESGRDVLKKNSLKRIISTGSFVLFKTQYVTYLLANKPFRKQNFENMIALSIGGDNYCYKSSPSLLKRHHNKIKKDNAISVLWGCSVDPGMLNRSLIKDLKKYDLITARESITFNGLKNAGIINVKLFPDPAFALKQELVELPDGFEEGNMIGINFSPHALIFSKESNMAFDNVVVLIEWILKNTDRKIILISHVEKPGNSDSATMKPLYDKFVDTGRVIQADDSLNCMQTKYIISKCSYFIGARTHATIAAYSTCVPTLVVGYSVKARGIAKDIFGTEEKYVIQTQSLKNKEDLTNAFKYIYENGNSICKHLESFMPKYIEKTLSAGEEIKKLYDFTEKLND